MDFAQMNERKQSIGLIPSFTNNPNGTFAITASVGTILTCIYFGILNNIIYLTIIICYSMSVSFCKSIAICYSMEIIQIFILYRM